MIELRPLILRALGLICAIGLLACSDRATGTTDGGSPPGKAPAKHRATATACDNTRPSNDPNVPPAGGPPVNCRTHAECTNGKNGRCGGNGHDGWNCTYDECFSDADCTGKAVCQCEGGFRADNNVCVASLCETDADCGAGGFCSPSFGSCGNYSGITGYFCHTKKDECVNDADCGKQDGGFGDPYCMYNKTVGYWKCSNSHCLG